MSEGARRAGADPRFARRTDWRTAPNPLAEAAAALRARSAPLIDLTASNPTACGFEYLKQVPWLKELSRPEGMRYDPDPRGLPAARRAVREYYASKGVAVDERHIFLTASTSESYSHLFKLLCDPGEAVLVPAPSYPLLDYLTGLNDAHLERYHLRYDGRWRLDAAELDRAAGIRHPKAIVVVNPNNPTGHFTGASERGHIERLAGRRGAAVISDEVFLDFAWRQDAQAFSFAAEGAALTFTLGGVSKMLGLPQMKLGWIVVGGPADARERACERLEVICDTYLSVNTPAQAALPAWMGERRHAETEIVRRLRRNLGRLEEALAPHAGAAEVLAGEGGWSAVVRLGTGEPDEAFALRLLREGGVLTHPGYFFDFQEECVVVSLLAPEAEFERGVALLARSL